METPDATTEAVAGGQIVYSGAGNPREMCVFSGAGNHDEPSVSSEIDNPDEPIEDKPCYSGAGNPDEELTNKRFQSLDVLEREDHDKRSYKTMTTPVSASKTEAETDVKATAPVKAEMNWITWSEKSKDVPFKSTIAYVGDGEQKLSKELDTPILGQNSSYDMLPILEGVPTQCDAKKLDAQNDFNTGKKGRDILRPIKLHLTILLDYLRTFVKSDIFTPAEKDALLLFQDVSPDELSVKNLKKLIDICVMLNLKKKTLRSNIPMISFTAHEQTTDIPLDLYYDIMKKQKLVFPPEFSSYIESILILQKMEHNYIDEPQKLMEDLDSLVGKLFTDLRIIIVHEQKGYLILTDISKIQFYRITRGSPRFKILF